jgi:hypothetical protein
MAGERKTSFLELEDADVAAYASGPDAAIAVPAEYLGAVVANLRGLYRHAEIVKAALASAPEADAPQDDAPMGPFEP